MITPEFQTLGQLFGSVGWSDDTVATTLASQSVPNSRKRSHSALLQEPIVKPAPALAFDFDDEQAAIAQSNTVFHRFFDQITTDSELARSVRNFTAALNGHSIDSNNANQSIDNQNQSNEPQTPSKSNQSNDDVISELSPLPNIPGVTDVPPTPDSAVNQQNNSMVDEIEPIPRSIREIYRQSNLNKKPGKVSLNQSEDLTPTHDVSQTEDSSSVHPNKKQKRRTTDEFFNDVGWSADNEQSNKQPTQAASQSQPSNSNNQSSKQSKSNKGKQTNKPGKSAIQSFDYDSALAAEDQSKIDEAKQNAENERVRKLMDRGATKVHRQQSRDPSQIKKSRVPKFLTSRQFTVKGNK